jgi:hypothetical protein
LINPDQALSLADVKDRIRERKDVGEEAAEPEEAVEERPAEREDHRTRRVADWFRHLRFRAGLFEDWYPFSVSANADEVSVRKPTTPKHRLYVFLLLGSNLRYLRAHIDQITTCFEIVSAAVLRKMLPVGAEVHHFGPRHQAGRYMGSLWRKMERLAADLADPLVAKRADFPENNVGDGGLDLVGWVPMGDQLSTHLLTFGQCACTSEWVVKQHSSGPAAWAGRIRFRAFPTNLVFIPFSFRTTDGAWHREDDIHQSVLIDRVRILNTLGDPIAFGDCEETISAVLEQREGLV